MREGVQTAAAKSTFLALAGLWLASYPALSAPEMYEVSDDTTVRGGYARIKDDMLKGMQIASDATGMVMLTSSAGKTITCTGTAIAKDAVITAHHCIADGVASAYFIPNYIKEEQWIEGSYERIELETSPLVWPTAPGRRVEQVSPHDKYDFVVLRAKRALFATIFKVRDPRSDDRIEIIEHPRRDPKSYARPCVWLKDKTSDIFLYHDCSTDKGSSGALVLTLAATTEDRFDLLPSAIHTDDKDPKVVGSQKRATRLSYIVAKVTDPKEPLLGGTVIKALDDWWKGKDVTNTNAPALADLAGGDAARPVTFSAPAKEQGAGAPASPSYEVGFSPPTNAIYRFTNGETGLKTKQHGLDLVDFRVRGSSAETMKRLTDALPPEFRPPVTNTSAVGAQETIAFQRGDGEWRPHKFPRWGLSTVWGDTAVTLPNGVELAWSQAQTWRDLEDYCESREGHAFGVPSFYQALESFAYVFRSDWSDADLSPRDCLVFERGASLDDVPTFASAKRFDMRKAGPPGRKIEEGYERSVVYNLAFEIDNGLVPTCVDRTGPDCITMLRFHVLREKVVQGKEGDPDDYWPVYRDGVADLLTTIMRDGERAVVRVDRCIFRAGPTDPWPTAAQMKAGQCPRTSGLGGSPFPLFIEYQRGRGIVCQLSFFDYSFENTPHRRVTRTRPIGVAAAGCLSQFALR